MTCVLDYIRDFEVPAIKVTSPRFTETTRARIEKASRECLAFDQLAYKCYYFVKVAVIFEVWILA